MTCLDSLKKNQNNPSINLASGITNHFGFPDLKALPVLLDIVSLGSPRRRKFPAKSIKYKKLNMNLNIIILAPLVLVQCNL